jgi:Mg-chelatase subunit ChlD
MAALAGADLALILMADCSASVTYDEFNLIAGGMAAALRDTHVVAGMLGGPQRMTLASVLLFSGRDAQDVVVDWTRIASPAEAAAFADAVDNVPRVLRPGLTAIGNALAVASALLVRAPCPAARHVVDVAGDGRANDGVSPAPLRDALALAGVTINGLCVLHEEPDLVAYFQQEVIGGPGAFALVCGDYKDFAEAMRRKLLREVTDRPIA